MAICLGIYPIFRQTQIEPFKRKKQHLVRCHEFNVSTSVAIFVPLSLREMLLRHQLHFNLEWEASSYMSHPDLHFFGRGIWIPSTFIRPTLPHEICVSHRPSYAMWLISVYALQTSEKAPQHLSLKIAEIWAMWQAKHVTLWLWLTVRHGFSLAHLWLGFSMAMLVLTRG